MNFEWEHLARIGIAALFGGVIGIERELHGQPAGLRTHMVVCLGSALMMLVSIHVGNLVSWPTDPARIAAQVVTGIGFLGAGAIVRYGTGVRGLTTAACIWTVAGIGLATGLGWYWGAATATLLTSITIFMFDKIERRIIGGKHTKKIVVRLRERSGAVEEIHKTLEACKIIVRDMGLQRDMVQKKIQLNMLATCPDGCDFDALTRDLGRIAEVEVVEIE